MIIKAHETHKINFSKNKMLLLYGNNEGAKSEVIKGLVIRVGIEAVIAGNASIDFNPFA